MPEFNRLAAAAAGYGGIVAENGVSFEHLLDTLKRASGALREAEVPFVLGGGVAVWARGGPETDHDLDFFVKPDDAERALEVLAAEGFRPEKPPEGWLYKAWDGDVLVDLIFDPSGVTIDDEFIANAPMTEVHAVRMRVLRPEDVLVTKLLAMREHSIDYESVLEIARAVREQIDWDEVRRRTDDWPYAKAFFTLVDELEVSA
ncbi:MAG: nucleotidyltransferase [Gaiellaceae bacterium]